MPDTTSSPPSSYPISGPPKPPPAKGANKQDVLNEMLKKKIGQEPGTGTGTGTDASTDASTDTSTGTGTGMGTGMGRGKIDPKKKAVFGTLFANLQRPDQNNPRNTDLSDEQGQQPSLADMLAKRQASVLKRHAPVQPGASPQVTSNPERSAIQTHPVVSNPDTSAKPNLTPLTPDELRTRAEKYKKRYEISQMYATIAEMARNGTQVIGDPSGEVGDDLDPENCHMLPTTLDKYNPSDNEDYCNGTVNEMSIPAIRKLIEQLENELLNNNIELDLNDKLFQGECTGESTGDSSKKTKGTVAFYKAFLKNEARNNYSALKDKINKDLDSDIVNEKNRDSVGKYYQEVVKLETEQAQKETEASKRNMIISDATDIILKELKDKQQWGNSMDQELQKQARNITSEIIYNKVKDTIRPQDSNIKFSLEQLGMTQNPIAEDLGQDKEMTKNPIAEELKKINDPNASVQDKATDWFLLQSYEKVQDIQRNATTQNRLGNLTLVALPELVKLNKKDGGNIEQLLSEEQKQTGKKKYEIPVGTEILERIYKEITEKEEQLKKICMVNLLRQIPDIDHDKIIKEYQNDLKQCQKDGENQAKCVMLVNQNFVNKFPQMKDLVYPWSNYDWDNTTFTDESEYKATVNKLNAEIDQKYTIITNNCSAFPTKYIASIETEAWKQDSNRLRKVLKKEYQNCLTTEHKIRGETITNPAIYDPNSLFCQQCAKLEPDGEGLRLTDEDIDKKVKQAQSNLELEFFYTPIEGTVDWYKDHYTKNILMDQKLDKAGKYTKLYDKILSDIRKNILKPKNMTKVAKYLHSINKQGKAEGEILADLRKTTVSKSGKRLKQAVSKVMSSEASGNINAEWQAAVRTKNLKTDPAEQFLKLEKTREAKLQELFKGEQSTKQDQDQELAKLQTQSHNLDETKDKELKRIRDQIKEIDGQIENIQTQLKGNLSAEDTQPLKAELATLQIRRPDLNNKYIEIADEAAI